jgi:hypothetical protein
VSDPFAPAARPIPVTVVAAGDLPVPAAGTALLRLEPSRHAHAPGAECVACAASSDIRAMLFDLLTQARQEQRALSSVVVDARSLDDVQTVLDRLGRGQPALGLRDHTVLRSFVLAAS